MNIDTNKLKQGKRDEIIKKKRNFIENKFVNRKLEKKGGGKSVPRVLISIYIGSTHAI
jgi:hypothetical protein